MICYSGICSATSLIAETNSNMGSHCNMGDSSDEHQVVIQNASTADCEISQCCYETLTNSSIDDNSGYKTSDVLYLIDFPTSLNKNSSKSIDLIFTRSVHDPPDIYLSVSSFLL